MNKKTKSAPDAGKPMLDTCTDARFSLGGELGRRIEAVTRQWILPATIRCGVSGQGMEDE